MAERSATRAPGLTRADRLLSVLRDLAVSVRDLGMSRQLIEDNELHGESIILDGRKLGNFGLCSYLGLGNDERVRTAAREAIDRYGTSYSSSIAYTAVPLYGELRELLGQIFDASVVLAGTTTLGHLASLPVMVKSSDQVLVDSHVHASVTTAAQVLHAGGVQVRPVSHADASALEAAIEGALSESERVWFLTDGVFSMQGDTAPAEEIYRLLETYPGLHVYCDDAHGFGWDGERGQGQFLKRSGWHDRLVVIVGLAKAFGSLGGVVATSDSQLAEMIELSSPALTFAGPIPPPNLGASIASARICLSDELPGLQEELKERIQLVNSLGPEMGLRFASSEETPLWFYEVGSRNDMLRLLEAIRDAGFFLNAAAFPVVPHGHAGLRFTVTLDNSLIQIENMLTALNDARLRLFGATEVEVDLTSVGSVAE